MTTARPPGPPGNPPGRRSGPGLRPRLTALATEAKADPVGWLSMGDIFGPLATDPTYVAAFTTALKSLWTRGTKATLEAYLGGVL